LEDSIGFLVPRPTVPSVFEFWPGEGFGDVAPPLFRGMVQHHRQRRQKIADDCPWFFALKALDDNLISSSVNSNVPLTQLTRA
jgi:hypothetical protein